MCAYERMQSRFSTPNYAREHIRQNIAACRDLERLNEEMGPDGDGWSDLVSLDARPDKGLIHRGIDQTDQLTRLFPKVRNDLASSRDGWELSMSLSYLLTPNRLNLT